MRGWDFRKMVYRDNFPIPAESCREGYFSDCDISYWLQGLACFLKTMQVVRGNGLEPRTILDFGSATGRVTRHFCNQLDDTTVWAADINRDHMDWLQTHIPRNPIPVWVGERPGLPIADDTLDLVCAYSVFTHIDEQELSWLRELMRILRPGGLAYLTVHNDATWQALAAAGESSRLLNSMIRSPGFDVADLQKPIPAGKTVFHFADSGPYRSQVFHSDDYLNQTWGREFRILEILPRRHQLQSVVLLQKQDAGPGST